MKLLILAGSQPRHRYVVKRLALLNVETKVVIMNRESMLPTPPDETSMRDRRLFERHFELREASEARHFGSADTGVWIQEVADLVVEPTQLNGVETARFIAAFHPDVCLVFGTDLIKEPVFGNLPDLTFNIHLGLSPWYRGSATLFWPFYFMEPQCAGATIHRLVQAVDYGDVAYQSTPSLQVGMGIHDVGSSTVVSLCSKLEAMLDLISHGRKLVFAQQRSSGRIFRVRDFRAAHLRVNYEIFEDRMVDAWLAGDLGGHEPSLVQLSHE